VWATFSRLIISLTDYKTDAVIQTTLRSRLGSDITVITVAHRLQTIMDADKIVGFLQCGPQVLADLNNY